MERKSRFNGTKIMHSTFIVCRTTGWYVNGWYVNVEFGVNLSPAPRPGFIAYIRLQAERSCLQIIEAWLLSSCSFNVALDKS